VTQPTHTALSREERRASLDLYGRLALAVAGVWSATYALALAWAEAAILGTAPAERASTWAWATPAIVTYVGLLVQLAVSCPVLTWPERAWATARPGRLLPRLGLVLATPALPVIAARLRRATRPPDMTSYVQLLGLPQLIVIQTTAWGGLSLAVSAIGIAAHYDWPVTTTVLLLALWLAAFAPFVAFAGVAARKAVVARATAFPGAITLHSAGGARFAVRWAASAALLAQAIVLVPLLSGKLWIEQYRIVRAERHARSIAAQVQHFTASSAHAALGAFLARHPDVAVALSTGRVYGAVERVVEAREGLVDLDDDGWPDRVVVPIPTGRVIVDTGPRDVVPAATFLLALVALGGGLILSIARYARMLDRDLAHARAYVDALLEDTPPSLPDVRAIRTSDVRSLVEAVSRLVDRTIETNIARYVATEKTREAERVKSQFLANMSHDLRSPLNAVLGFSELLLTGIDGELDEEDRAMVGQIHESGRHLLSQIDDILDMAKVEAGRMHLSPEPTPPVTLLSRATAAVRKDLGEAVTLRTQAAPGLPPVHVDGYRTAQAIENVLRFAAIHAGDRPVDVTLRPHDRPDGRFVLVRIHADTRALSAADLGRARRGFLRIPGQPGLGLGLPLASALLDLQGGRLRVEEGPDGVVFTLELPAPHMSRKLILGETPPEGLDFENSR